MLPLQNFKDYICLNSLFNAKDKILLTVSGGKDSVLMVHLFKLSGFKFGIAHCNFNLRGAESQRDEEFVKMLAEKLDVPFHVTHFKTKEFAATHKVSTQMAARTLRYQWFEELREREQYKAIALAQHQDDAIETVLLNLTRGTGIAGLHGILPKRGKLIRPLLFLSSAEIADLISKQDIDFVEDSSNKSTDYARNKIRLKVIPHLKEINPGLEETFQHNIKRFADTELVLQHTVTKLKEEILKEKQGKFYISIKEIKALNPQHLLVFELLKPFDFSESVVAELLEGLDKQSGTAFFSVSHRIVVDRQELIINPLSDQNMVNKNQIIHSHDETVNFLGSQILITSSEDIQFKKSSNKAYVDTDKLIFPLVLRTWQAGDKFKPIGMNSYKKLSNFFIDEKIPLSDKDLIPILVNGNGELIWIAGWRQDNRYKLTEATKNVTIFELRHLHITISKQS
ncbi:MAG: tRNA lysidine(34) synthetase TilS [Candidatus Pedobacter colombiensis]|uniref:tRNA(Ile)-lysidine synthase n=1 Tax=Candidatus Pedobacter colombiensis TaxID=3121371 RepID=A0AAJ5WAA7_9SPHI|nr:tRNA lysidine(34) synthetase TilS [Pedobacter sp.]WEK19784.1 MAG: tRNA lysidine(34) synthetase TilS [Pedobacter sp.]